MAINPTFRLDPRLRRLVKSCESPERLQGDQSRDFIARVAAVGAAEPIEASQFTKRVLVSSTTAEPQFPPSVTRVLHLIDRFYSVEVQIDGLEELARSPDVEFVEAGRQLHTELLSSVPECRADLAVDQRTGSALTGRGVVVAIIDFGFDFTLHDFRDSNGQTRIAFLWDQSLTPQSGETSPAPFGYGVEYDRAAIDADLGSGSPFSLVRHAPGAGSHGTHVAGIAAGNGRSGDPTFPPGQYAGVATEATLVVVQPQTKPSDATFTDSVQVAEAIEYCFRKADDLGMPCVVNISLGQNGGSHDGESIVERAIDAYLGSQGRAIVLAAGNEHIWRGHSSGVVSTGLITTLGWHVGGGLPLPGGGALPPGAGDFSPNEMEIWFSPRDQFRARVVSPSGETTPWVEPGDSNLEVMQNGDEVFLSSERITVLNGDSQIYLEVSPPSQNVPLQSGTWLVEIEGVDVRDGSFDAWIERDARRATNSFADQSFFVGADFDGRMTLGTPATARRGIAVANYDHVTDAPADSSSRGRTRDGREKPEVAAPGTNILSSNSLHSQTGQPPRIEKSGTSMAAPHVTGVAAQLLEAEPRLTSEQIKKILIASARSAVGVSGFDEAWGFGKLDAEVAARFV